MLCKMTPSVQTLSPRAGTASNLCGWAE